jgi:LEA14-like dessication related protein
MKRILFLLPVLLLLTSCGIKPIVPTGVQDVKFSNFDFMKGLVTLDMGLKIDNPNALALTIYGSELDITVGKTPLGKVSMNDKIKIKRKCQEVYRIKVTAQLKDILTGLPTLISTIAKKQSNVSVKGWVKAGTLGVRKTFPIDIIQKDVPVENTEKK